MTGNVEQLAQCQLFQGVRPEEIAGMLACLGAQVKRVAKQETVFFEGDPARYVGVLLSGRLQVVQDDYYGARSVFGVVEPPELFGESFACAGVETLPVSVTAMEDSEVMLLDCRRITMTCTNACPVHNRVVLNLLKVMASKNLAFHRKMEITAKRTTREKLMAFLLAQAKEQGSSSFTIPYDRQALANYLGVERSAMSAEISKLRAEGVLESERSFFRLL